MKLKIKKNRIIFIALAILLCLSSIILFYQKETVKVYELKADKRKTSLEELERMGFKLNNV